MSDDKYGRGRGRDVEWSGDNSFGGGWGNQTPRPERLGDRNYRGESDDPYADAPRYGAAPSEGYGAEERFGGISSDPARFASAPGYDPSFGGPRFDRADVGSTGTHGVHPVASPSGGDYGFGIGGYSSARRYAMLDRGGQQQEKRRNDPHYQAWRNRQIEEFDRDYQEYHRERQSRFEQEFAAWRERRGQQREALGKAREKMAVIGSDGGHVGTVDAIRGDHIVLTKNDANAGGAHHSIPCSWIEDIDEQVRLNISADDAMKRWRNVERSGALFDRGDSNNGPHVLNRSFSGTYRDDD